MPLFLDVHDFFQWVAEKGGIEDGALSKLNEHVAQTNKQTNKESYSGMLNLF